MAGTALVFISGTVGGGVLFKPPSFLDVFTLLLQHLKITIPGKCSHQKPANGSLQKTVALKNQQDAREKEKAVLLPGVSSGKC